MKRRYWINTEGRQIRLISLLTYEPRREQILMYGLKECNWLTHWIFCNLKINLKAKDIFKWLRNS